MQSTNNPAGGGGGAKPPRAHANPEDEYENANEEDKHDGGAVPAAASGDDPDEKSIFVKNVHFSATVEDLKQHFSDCGDISRVTIPIEKMTSKPKGYAYIEFVNKESVMKAKMHNDSLFKGR